MVADTSDPRESKNKQTKIQAKQMNKPSKSKSGKHLRNSKKYPLSCYLPTHMKQDRSGWRGLKGLGERKRGNKQKI